MKHGSGIKDRDDRSIGIEIRITEALAKINPTDPLILAKQASRRNLNCSDSSGNSLTRAEASRCRHYRQLYINRPEPIAFMSVAVDTAGRIDEDFSRLLFFARPP